ncbi:MAG: hypothetical protein DI537_40370 [Stutzerimonas stutzeri]|nr:MAG: hypothetical protein DI537_40370 [Stutzerimonas stutzeri]
MSDPRITPRSAAFQQQHPIEHAAQEHAALATHGDPSVRQPDANAGSSKSQGGVRVDWVYASDIGNRLAAGAMARSADAAIRVHAWLRDQGKRGLHLPKRGASEPPSTEELGLDTPTPEPSVRPPSL